MIANISIRGILNACGIYFNEIYTLEIFRTHHFHSNRRADVHVAEGIDAPEKLSRRSTLIRYNETKPRVHLSDEMTHRFTL